MAPNDNDKTQLIEPNTPNLTLVKNDTPDMKPPIPIKPTPVPVKEPTPIKELVKILNKNGREFAGSKEEFMTRIREILRYSGGDSQQQIQTAKKIENEFPE